MVTLEGEVLRTTYESETSGFRIVRLGVPGRSEPVTLVGCFLACIRGPPFGLGKKRIAAVVDAWRENRALHGVMVFLQANASYVRGSQEDAWDHSPSAEMDRKKRCAHELCKFDGGLRRAIRRGLMT